MKYSLSRSTVGLTGRFLATCFFIALCPFVAIAQADLVDLGQLSGWQGSVFGDVGGDNRIVPENFAITAAADDSVLLRSSNNRGKIAGSSEGIAFLFREIAANKNFELEASFQILDFTVNNQVSFGIMVRDRVYQNLSTRDDLGSYLAVGPIDAARNPSRYAFSRDDDGLEKYGYLENTPGPAAGISYTMKIRRSGNFWALSLGNEETQVLEFFQGSSQSLFAGFFTSRNTSVRVSGIRYTALPDIGTELTLGGGTPKLEYLPGQDLDLGTAQVLRNSDGRRISSDEFFVSGFSTSEVGSRQLSIHYAGASASLRYSVQPLSLSGLQLRFPPHNTNYYTGDIFDARGIELRAVYNNGYLYEDLDPSRIALSINGTPAAGQRLSTAGLVQVRASLIGEPSIGASFEIRVQDAKVSSLDVVREPFRQDYYVGDSYDASGLLLQVSYSDGKKFLVEEGSYTVLAPSMQSAGERLATFSYKDARVSLPVLVQAVELLGLRVVEYPKTTLHPGETFDPSGLTVAAVYNNGTQKRLEPSEYSIATAGINYTRAGRYTISIRPRSADLAPIQLGVSVVTTPAPQWKQIAFGQSTSESRNTIEFLADGGVKLSALDGAGKITGDHDGITFYYVELDSATQNFALEADITVLDYAKEPHDGQESFGIMARDVIGSPNDSSIFASNIVGIGGYSGGTRNPNGTQVFQRSGVTSPDGAGSQGMEYSMLQNTKPSTATSAPAVPYRLRLEKTNSGYRGTLNGSDSHSFWQPDLLTAQDGKVYVGFYTARVASIVVRNIQLYISDAASDAPAIIPSRSATTPSFEVLSLSHTGQPGYTLALRANVQGRFSINQGFTSISNATSVRAGEILTYWTNLEQAGENPFSIAFTPERSLALTSYQPIYKNFAVTLRSFTGMETIHVSPFGKPDASGTMDNPVDLDTAIQYVRPGQRIVLGAGDYLRTTPLNIHRFNDGNARARKVLEAAPGQKVLIDFQRLSEGAILSGNYWHIKGIAFARSAGNTKGMTVGGSHNIIEDCVFFENGDTGLQISRTDILENRITFWPSHNLILNCESYDNADPSQNNADGFAAKLTSGYGNIFRGCVAHHNIDDGWDLYTKAGTGVIGAVILENCVAWGNGSLSSGIEGNGDKNGFKLGGEGIAVKHILRNSLAYANGAAGITSNSNPALIIENSYSANNKGANIVLGTYTGTAPDFQLDGVASFRQGVPQVRDQVPAGYQAPQNYLSTGSQSVNSSGAVLSRAQFVELLSKAGFDAGKVFE